MPFPFGHVGCVWGNKLQKQLTCISKDYYSNKKPAQGTFSSVMKLTLIREKSNITDCYFEQCYMIFIPSLEWAYSNKKQTFLCLPFYSCSFFGWTSDGADWRFYEKYCNLGHIAYLENKSIHNGLTAICCLFLSIVICSPISKAP